MTTKQLQIILAFLIIALLIQGFRRVLRSGKLQPGQCTGGNYDLWPFNGVVCKAPDKKF